MKISKNTNFGTHNTSKRSGSIQYICIHYVGATGDAKANINYYNQPTTTNASADFYVGHGGDVWQYNPDPKARYCWAVGGGLQSEHGGSFFGKAKNSNSISIEMCVKTRGSKVANSKDWYFTDETVESAVELTKHLMEEYNIPAERVIRHYDVTGKYCPGVFGWNPQSGSEAAWKEFKAKITEEDEEMTQEQFDKMMDNYLERLAKKTPSGWSAEARTWAEKAGIIKGDGTSKKDQSFCTREELVQILHRWEGRR